MSSITTRKLRKSVKLSEKQRAYIKNEMSKCATRVAIAIRFQVSADVLDRVVLTGVCHEKTYHILFPEDPLPED